MSHYTEIQTVLKDPAAIVKALAKSYNCKESDVIVSNGRALRGYQGDDRSAKAKDSPDYAPPCEIVLPRQFIGGASNDIGFQKQEDGTYKAYISEYDAHKWNSVKQKFHTTYGMSVLEKQAAKNKWRINKVTTRSDGKLVVKLANRNW